MTSWNYRDIFDNLSRTVFSTASAVFSLCFLFCFSSIFTVFADETRAMEKMILIIDRLNAINEQLLGEPITGTVAINDTVSFSMNLVPEFAYHIYITTDSAFNIFGFWASFDDSTYSSDAGHKASLVIFPDTSGEWKMYIVLLEGDYSDSASFAMVMTKNPREILFRDTASDSLEALYDD